MIAACPSLSTHARVPWKIVPRCGSSYTSPDPAPLVRGGFALFGPILRNAAKVNVYAET
jgi:hypothetical protein